MTTFSRKVSLVVKNKSLCNRLEFSSRNFVPVVLVLSSTVFTEVESSINVCPRRDAGAAARAFRRRGPRAEPSTGVVEGPQGGEARKGDASGGRHVASGGDSCGSRQLWRVKGSARFSESPTKSEIIR